MKWPEPMAAHDETSIATRPTLAAGFQYLRASSSLPVLRRERAIHQKQSPATSPPATRKAALIVWAKV